MRSKALKTCYFILSLFFIFFISGCGININLDPYKDGKTPENDFTLSNFLNNNMILQQDKEFTISGISEKGVVLTASIFDEEGDMVSQTITIAGELGQFELKVKGIAGSNKRYRLEVSDGFHTHKFKNIMFGEVWMISGEYKDTLSYSMDTDDANLDNIKFVQYENESLKWYSYEDAVNVSDNIKSFAAYLNTKVNIPIAIIDASLDECYADAWLKEDIATNYLNIKKYLTSINRYNTSNSTSSTNSLGSMYNIFINSLKDFSIAGIIWNQGTSDFKHYNSQNRGSFVTNYSYLLLQMFTEFNNVFGNDIDIYTIQETYLDEAFANDLRFAQAIPSYQLENVELIVTYDTYLLETEELINEDIESEQDGQYAFSIEKYLLRVCESVYQITYNKNAMFKSPAFNEVLTNNNVIKISFSFGQNLENVDELYGLSVQDSSGNLLEYTYQINGNSIIITLVLEENQDINDIECIITYAYVDEIYLCNLKTINGLPVVPFEIKIN